MNYVAHPATNHHTPAIQGVAEECQRLGRPIATRTDLNTDSARTRHTAAWWMAQDPNMAITDVQWILGHASLSTTQRYTNLQELHQTGEKLQVARLTWCPTRLHKAFSLAA